MLNQSVATFCWTLHSQNHNAIYSQLKRTVLVYHASSTQLRGLPSGRRARAREKRSWVAFILTSVIVRGRRDDAAAAAVALTVEKVLLISQLVQILHCIAKSAQKWALERSHFRPQTWQISLIKKDILARPFRHGCRGTFFWGGERIKGP